MRMAWYFGREVDTGCLHERKKLIRLIMLRFIRVEYKQYTDYLKLSLYFEWLLPWLAIGGPERYTQLALIIIELIGSLNSDMSVTTMPLFSSPVMEG